MSDSQSYAVPIPDEKSVAHMLSAFWSKANYDNLTNLKGKILTHIDATFQDKEQRKAQKDIISQLIDVTRYKDFSDANYISDKFLTSVLGDSSYYGDSHAGFNKFEGINEDKLEFKYTREKK